MLYAGWPIPCQLDRAHRKLNRKWDEVRPREVEDKAQDGNAKQWPGAEDLTSVLYLPRIW